MILNGFLQESDDIIFMEKTMKAWITALGIIFSFILITTSISSQGTGVKEIDQISVEIAWEKVKSGDALLICSYGGSCEDILLEGAILHKELETRLPSQSKNQEIIFYCDWPDEATSAGLAEKYIKKGFTNVKVLKGGVEAWTDAGYSIQ